MMTTTDTERRTVLDAASTIFDSIGEILICVDGDFRVVYAPPEMRDAIGAPVATIFGAEVDGLLRQGRRAETRATLRTKTGTRSVQATLAPYVARTDGDRDVKYVIVFRTIEEPDTARARIIAALEANRWRRDAAARSLGISRATLWRKMRELGLL